MISIEEIIVDIIFALINCAIGFRLGYNWNKKGNDKNIKGDR